MNCSLLEKWINEIPITQQTFSTTWIFDYYQLFYGSNMTKTTSFDDKGHNGFEIANIWHTGLKTQAIGHCYSYNYNRYISCLSIRKLLALYGVIYVPHKQQRCPETDSAQHEEEPITDASHVTKEEWCLHETWHIWSCMIVIHTVTKYEYAGGASTKDRPAW